MAGFQKEQLSFKKKGMPQDLLRLRREEIPRHQAGLRKVQKRRIPVKPHKLQARPHKVQKRRIPARRSQDQTRPHKLLAKLLKMQLLRKWLRPRMSGWAEWKRA